MPVDWTPTCQSRWANILSSSRRGTVLGMSTRRRGQSPCSDGELASFSWLAGLCIRFSLVGRIIRRKAVRRRLFMQKHKILCLLLVVCLGSSVLAQKKPRETERKAPGQANASAEQNKV